MTDTAAVPTMSTAAIANPIPAALASVASSLRPSVNTTRDEATHRLSPEALERDQMLMRLHNLRSVLPALAQEMAVARRQAARLRTDNRRLTEQVRRLRRELAMHEHRST